MGKSFTKGDLKEDQLPIIACQPVFPPTTMPEGIPELPMKIVPGIPLYSGSGKRECSVCDCEIFVGPTQKEVIDEFPDYCVVCCWTCAALLCRMSYVEPEIRSLGNERTPGPEMN
jgi:hypothetical protein